MHWHLRDLASALLHKNAIQHWSLCHFGMFTVHTSFVLQNKLRLVNCEFRKNVPKVATKACSWVTWLWHNTNTWSVGFLSTLLLNASTVTDNCQHEITVWEETGMTGWGFYQCSLIWRKCACTFTYHSDKQQKQGLTGRADICWVFVENHSQMHLDLGSWKNG